MNPLALLMTWEFDDSDIPTILQELLRHPDLCRFPMLPSESVDLIGRFVERLEGYLASGVAGKDTADMRRLLSVVCDRTPDTFSELIESESDDTKLGESIQERALDSDHMHTYYMWETACIAILKKFGIRADWEEVGRLTRLLWTHMES